LNPRRAGRSVLVLGALLALACRQREQQAHAEVHAALAAASGSAAKAAPQLEQHTQALPPPADCAEPPQDAQRLASGAATRILHAGSGPERAADNDIVTLDHSVWKRDGTVVDSTKLVGQPMVQPLHGLVARLREVVAQMAVGETRLLWLPDHTPTGDGPSAPTTPFATTLELTLVSLVKAPATPRDLAGPPPKAKRTASGLGYQLLAKGHGARPSPQSSVELLHTTWSSDGKVVESTAMAKTSALYGPRDLLPGLREGVALMRVGDKMRFWLPAQLAYGEQPRQGRPAGPLVADVELLATR